MNIMHAWYFSYSPRDWMDGGKPPSPPHVTLVWTPDAATEMESDPLPILPRAPCLGHCQQTLHCLTRKVDLPSLGSPTQICFWPV